MNKCLLLIFIGVFVFTNCYALKPAKKYDVIPDTLKLPYEKNTVVTSDNIKLASWTMLPPRENNNHITIVMAYPDAGNMSWWLSQAAILSQNGFTVVLFDYRGFGESDPMIIDPRMLYYDEFAKDLTDVVHFARNKYPKNKTGIWALSMGTIAATLSAGNARPDFIIAEGLVTDPARLQSHYAKSHETILLPPSAAHYGEQLKKLRMPLCIFSGQKDVVTTDAEVKKLKQNKANVRIVNFNGTHLQGFYMLSQDYPGSEYVLAIKHFLKIG
jgi:predicted alpha/beta hydrolase